MSKLLSFLAGVSPVVIVGNPNVEGNPLVTPSVDGQGNARTDSNGNQMGTIRMEQHINTVTGTYLNSRRRVAFVTGTLETLNNIVKGNKLENGSQVPGKIVQKESLTPMWPTQNPKQNPNTGEPVGYTINGRFYPVYMQQRFVEDMNEQDKLIDSQEKALDMVNSLGIQPAEVIAGEIPVANPEIPA